MSKLRNTLATAVASLALGAGMLVAGPVQSAQAATCTTTPNVYCSMYWANRTNTSAKYNTRSYYVTALQKSLNNVGFPVGVTGHYNTYTVKAVKNYQYTRLLPVTGVLDYKTIQWLRVGAGGKRALTTTTTRAQKAVTFAYAQIGKPYSYGATGPSAYDCSGLTGASWRAAGITVPRTSYSQLSYGTAVSKANLKPGDIVGFYSGGHVGIYVGSGYVIHASRPGTPVQKVAMSTMPFYKAVRPAS
ncbi:C40 family peptidase [Aestuariimicrobium soli]|uniref:C40 family peptidase n=1 Tax=Aestuariimicrobium soli TaxID=2035834 RepID=UPI003EB96DFE